jgi:hypothetical protein
MSKREEKMELLLNKAVVELRLPTCETILMKTNIQQAAYDLYVELQLAAIERKTPIFLAYDDLAQFKTILDPQLGELMER